MFDATGQVRDWDMDGNDSWGDCVFAGEANYKRAVTKGTGVSEIQISANACIRDYLKYTGGSDEGADISSFLDGMERVGLQDDQRRYHKNGRHGALDVTSIQELRFGVSLFRGVKAAVAADILDSVIAGKSGWVCHETGSGPIDHNVELLGYGTVNECLTICGTKSALPDSLGLLPALLRRDHSNPSSERHTSESPIPSAATQCSGNLRPRPTSGKSSADSFSCRRP
jgi:hypothetical protein